MKIFNRIISYFLMLKSSAYQGSGQFQEVIRLSLKAKALNPRSKAALTFLADDYNRLKDYDLAKKVLEEALSLYPKDFHFNQLMVIARVESGEPIENAIPFIREYLRNTPPSEVKFPTPMRMFFRFLGKSSELDGFADRIGNWQTEWTRWAEDTLNEFESNKPIYPGRCT